MPAGLSRPSAVLAGSGLRPVSVPKTSTGIGAPATSAASTGEVAVMLAKIGLSVASEAAIVRISPVRLSVVYGMMTATSSRATGAGRKPRPGSVSSSSPKSDA